MSLAPVQEALASFGALLLLLFELLRPKHRQPSCENLTAHERAPACQTKLRPALWARLRYLFLAPVFNRNQGQESAPGKESHSLSSEHIETPTSGLLRNADQQHNKNTEFQKLTVQCAASQQADSRGISLKRPSFASRVARKIGPSLLPFS